MCKRNEASQRKKRKELVNLMMHQMIRGKREKAPEMVKLQAYLYSYLQKAININTLTTDLPRTMRIYL